ncbi:TonB-dependent receptor [Larkinella terrae]|uniref:TonB-dependent receptor plug domain-containing protein n=1 Tax=Larkinella terrae TaxID=2025311 RepID=A0A7K0ETU2_9BACT|nr:TonB-dependent receptor [Larkinella terrae]MRS64848.1 TonB-dependent receptor plug domain-containing protein [Larkinella terrae]
MRDRYFYCFAFLFLSLQQLIAQRVTLSGTVMRADTALPVVGASMFVVESGAGLTTDEQGRFSFSLRPGSYHIQLSAVGFKSERPFIVVNANRTAVFKLISQTFELDEVQVRDRRADQNVKDVRMSQIQLDVRQLKKMPAVLGEPDILKALTLQAGVSTAGEGAGGFNVRGGRTDQNLVLLDGAPMYNTSHLLGFYTNISSDVVQDVNLYKGSFSSQYGGRISSLLLVNTKAGNSERWRLSGGVSPVSGRVVVDGPIAKGLTLMAAGRLAYPNWILKSFPERSAAKQSRAFFYDGNLRLTYSPNAINTFSLSAYRSGDSFKFPGDTTYGWQSNVVSGRWSSLLRRNLQLNVNALYSGYQYHVDGETEGYTFRLTSYIQHREVKADLFYTLFEKHKLQIGANGILYKIQKGDQQPTGANSSINPKRLEPENARELGVYGNTEWILTPGITLQAGLRYSAYAQLGPQTVYRYAGQVPRSPETVVDSTVFADGKTIQTYGGLEPRLSLRLQVTPSMSLKLNYSRNRQYIHLISNTTAITPSDFWKVSDSFVPAQVADQIAVGVFKNLNDNAIEIALEGYYKNIDNLVEYRYGATLLLNERLETDLLRAHGKAYGVELSLAKNKGKLTGQFNYSYARSLVAVQTAYSELQVNQGAYYPSNFDKPHNLNIQTRLAMRYNWTFTTNFVYSTGVPATYPDGQYVFANQPTLNYSKRNADRVQDYHRLDIAFSKDTRLSNRQTRYSIWTIGIYNVYARKNPYSVYFNRANSRSEAYRLAVFGTVIPSITYNFNF